jgi:hypothetical protein
MAAIDFPASPADGQVFSAPNGAVYRWNAAKTAWLMSVANLAGVNPPIYDSNASLMTDAATLVGGGTDVPMQIAQGQVIFTRSFTALDPTHTIEVNAQAVIGNNGSVQSSWSKLALFIDGNAVSVAEATNYTYVESPYQVFWQGVLPAGPHTFQIRFAGGTTTYLNGYGGTRQGGGSQRATLKISELGGGVQGPPGPQGAAGAPGGPACTSGPTPPSSPVANQLWFNTDAGQGGGILYVWYDDGNSQQWVPVSPAEVVPPSGLLQMQSFETGALATGSTSIPFDDTIPQITEGDEYMNLAFTPKLATSRLIIRAKAILSPVGAANIVTALFQDALPNALAAEVSYKNAAGWIGPHTVTHIMPAGSTTVRTFRLRAGIGGGGQLTFNGAAAARYMGGAMASSLIVEEYA